MKKDTSPELPIISAESIIGNESILLNNDNNSNISPTALREFLNEIIELKNPSESKTLEQEYAEKLVVDIKNDLDSGVTPETRNEFLSEVNKVKENVKNIRDNMSADISTNNNNKHK